MEEITRIILTFIHLAGMIIGLGAVTVIDTLGFLGRKSKHWTLTTIEAHYITKPLIWLGTFLLAISWIFLYTKYGGILPKIKSILIIILILNGCFLSFYISPRLTKQRNKLKLLDKKLKNKILVSMLISFFSWWTLVFITAITLVIFP